MAALKQEESGRWRVRIRKQGHAPISKTFRTKAAAQSWANSTEDQLDRGELVDNMVAAEITMRKLLDKYEREVAERKKGYMNSERYRLDVLREGVGNLRAMALTPAEVVAYADERLETVSSDTVRRDLVVLSAAWEAAKTLFKYPLKGNPVNDATKLLNSTNTYTRPVERDRRPTTDELEKLRGELSEVNSDIMELAIETAMRCGEIAKASGEGRVDGGLLIEDDKTGKTTVIPISIRANEILDKYPEGFDRTASAVSRAFTRAVARAKIKDLRFHDLRHEGTSRLFEKGLSIEEVSRITRHSDWKSLKRYTHPKNEDITKKLG